MASVSKRLIDAVAAAGDGAGDLVLGVDELASAMSAAMAHQEANGFEPCNDKNCHLCFPFTASGN